MMDEEEILLEGESQGAPEPEESGVDHLLALGRAQGYVTFDDILNASPRRRRTWIS